MGDTCICLEGVPNSNAGCPIHRDPDYTPEYKELEEARQHANELSKCGPLWTPPTTTYTPNKPEGLIFATLWLAAEVRVMRLERALEQ